MAFAVMNAKSISLDGRLKLMAYGDPKVGKTTFGASFPNPFVIDADEGLMSVRGRDIDYGQVKSWQDIEPIYLYLLKESSRKKYETVIVDTLTVAQAFCMTDILQSRGAMFAEQRDWGQVLEMGRRFLRQLTDLPYHIVLLCQEANETDPISQVPKSVPALAGRLAYEAPAYVDIVMHMVVETKRGEDEIGHFGIFHPSHQAYAGDRLGIMPKVMKDPTGVKILNLVRKDTVSITNSRSATKKKLVHRKK